MKKILYILIILLASCASKKQVTTDTKSSNIKIDSVSQSTNETDEVSISWDFGTDPPSIKNDSSPIPPWAKPWMPKIDKPPKSGTITIKHTKSSSSATTKAEKKEKTKQKKKDTATKPKQVLKSNPAKSWLNAIYVIIFAILVKIVLDHKNKLKNVWNKMRKYISLHRH